MTRDGSHHGLQWRASPHQHLTEQHGEKPWHRRLTLLPIATLRGITTAEFHFSFLYPPLFAVLGGSRDPRGLFPRAPAPRTRWRKSPRHYNCARRESKSPVAMPRPQTMPGLVLERMAKVRIRRLCTGYAASGTGPRNYVSFWRQGMPPKK